MTTEASELAGLLEPLRELLEERAILQTLYRYGHTIDYGLEAEWVDLFTEDGVWDVRPVNDESRPRLRVSGRAELERFIATHTRAPETYHKHFLVEPLIRIDGNEATVESYYARIDEREDGPYFRSFGRYRDRMVKSADGRWRFRERTVESSL